MSRALFIFPHQDDEYFVAPRLRFEIASGRNPLCVFLTSGSHHDPALTSTRDQESTSYLKQFGVAHEDIRFVEGTKGRVPVNELPLALEYAYSSLCKIIEGESIDAIYCPAWEGGHQDHDATHLLALAVAQSRGIMSTTWQYFTYNGVQCFGRLFRVMRPTYFDPNALRRKISLGEAIRTAFSCTHYKSQRTTWVGLFPQALAKWILRREEVLFPVCVNAVWARPHLGKLSYESWRRMSFESFEKAATSFKLKHLKPSPNVLEESHLKKEGEAIYLQLFRQPASSELIHDYVKVHLNYFQKISTKWLSHLNRAVLGALDIEAIEFALRANNTVFTAKLKAISYLAEVQPENYSLYLNEKSARVSAFGSLIWHGLRTPWKKIKGHYLVWRHGLV